MRDYRQLKVWEKAHETTLAVYGAIRAFPDDERYGLTRQLRRASASIGTNIAEGCGHDSEKELARYLNIAAGSTSECEYLVELANDLGYLGVEANSTIGSGLTETKNAQQLYPKAKG